MKKLFISQPMNGKSSEEIADTKCKALADAQNIAGEELELINSFVSSYSDDPICGIAKCIELLSQADVVYFTEGWKQARGCRIEHVIAVEYELTILND